MKSKRIMPDNEETGYFQSILASATTGLPMIVWVSCCGNGYECTIKVQTNHSKRIDPKDIAFVSVENVRIVRGKLSDTDLALVKNFIKKNKRVLLDHWSNKLISTSEMIDAIKSLKKTLD